VEPLKVGICGLGTVAQGVLSVIQKNTALINRRAGRIIEISVVASRNPRPEVDLHGATFSNDIFEIPLRNELDVIVELIGGEDDASKVIKLALENGKHVVTANKAVMAIYGEKLLQAASASKLSLGFEGAIAGSVPIVMNLTEALIANEYELIAGIINGTSNYILTAMEKEQKTFQDALREAQDLGYAEADPKYDIEGVDAAHKLSILSALAFGTSLNFEKVHIEGISSITLNDIKYAELLGYSVKHLGITRRAENGVELRVHPCLVSSEHLMSRVEGSMNAVLVSGNAAGETLLAGPGAGALPTASAVVGDIMRAARSNFMPITVGESGPHILPIADAINPHYLRIPSLDRTGVFAKVATILSDYNISIDAAIQNEQIAVDEGDEGWVPIVILTHAVSESIMVEALEKVQKLPDIVGSITRIRVEHLGTDSK